MGNVIFDVKFGKTRRWRFKNERWVNFDREVGNWNTYVFGFATYEQWIDVRSGNTVNHSVSHPAQNGLPALNTSFSITARSHPLGTGIVQFTDPKSRIYNSMSFMRFKRM